MACILNGLGEPRVVLPRVFRLRPRVILWRGTSRTLLIRRLLVIL